MESEDAEKEGYDDDDDDDDDDDEDDDDDDDDEEEEEEEEEDDEESARASTWTMNADTAHACTSEDVSFISAKVQAK